MISFLLFLSVPVLLVLPFGVGVGWVGRVIPGSWAWLLGWALAAFVLPGVSLWGYLHETAEAAIRIPETAHVMHIFQAQTVALFVLTMALTLWATLRRPWLAPLPLPGMFFVFYRVVVSPIYGHGPYLDEQLSTQLDGSTMRGLFIFCALGAALLLGMALATLLPGRKLDS